MEPATAIAQRRDSTTGIEARSYLQVTTPKIESTTKETKPDLGVLTLIQRPGESKEEYLSRLSSFAPIAKTGKMVKQEDGEGKVNANDPSRLLDKTLYHVLTDILSLELDDWHVRWCYLLHTKDCDK